MTEQEQIELQKTILGEFIAGASIRQAAAAAGVSRNDAVKVIRKALETAIAKAAEQ